MQAGSVIITGQPEKLGGDPCKTVGRGGQAKGAHPCAPLARSAPACAGVNAARPGSAQASHVAPECGPFVIQHNAALREMGLNGPQRATCVMSAPGGAGALRVLSRLWCAACPRVRLLSLCLVQQLAGARSCRFGCSVLPQRRSRRPPWRLRCRSAGASSWGSLL